MEVIIPPPRSMEFDFNSARSSAYMSEPSTPKRFGEVYFSAPTSPSRISEFYREFDEFSNSSSSIPFGWEEKPGTPRSPKFRNPKSEQEGEDFAFDFCEDLEKASLSAEELFDGGKIKPLKPPPRLQQQLGRRAKTEDSVSSPLQGRKVTPRSPIKQGKRIISEALSPRRKKEKDPFKDAIQNSRKEAENGRGRDRNLGSNSGRKAARSLSPHRVSAYPWEEEERKPTQNSNTQNSKEALVASNPSFSNTSSKGSRKWSLKDFLLFRSKSEGRATDSDPFRKYSGIFRRQEDMKNSTSFRSNDGSISRRRGGPISAHELHYTVNKAVSQDLKKKTFLPYKQGILGRLAFNPAVNALANGFGSLSR